MHINQNLTIINQPTKYRHRNSLRKCLTIISSNTRYIITVYLIPESIGLLFTNKTLALSQNRSLNIIQELLKGCILILLTWKTYMSKTLTPVTRTEDLIIQHNFTTTPVSRPPT